MANTTDSSPDTVIVNINDVPKTRAPACLVIIAGAHVGKRLAFGNSPITIGRSPTSSLVIDEQGVSRHHAAFSMHRSGYTITDLKSTNGTYVNGERMRGGEHLLISGDRVRVGSVVFKFIASDHLESAYHDLMFQLSTRDDLTGVLNRRHLFGSATETLQRHRDTGMAVAVFLLDLDHFKAINDTHGHLAGDAVLREVCERIEGILPPEGILGRYGGEEFCVLIPNASRQDAATIAEHGRAAVLRKPVPWHTQPIPVTFSAGVSDTAECPAGSDDPAAHFEALLRNADKKLYEAKRRGRNRVIV